MLIKALAFLLQYTIVFYAFMYSIRAVNALVRAPKCTALSEPLMFAYIG